MKRKLKKVISVFLAVSMALQIAVTSYAESGVDFSSAFSSDDAVISDDGNTSAYVYNTSMGLLAKFTDALDNRTLYGYNGNNNRLIAVANDSNKNGSFDTSDIMVSYSYLSGRLSTITHNGFNYAFTYDNFGNMLTTSAGGNTLVTNTYQDKNGLLTKSAYGNGHNILYLYDELGRVYSEKHGSDPIIRYYYDNNGNLARLTGGQGGIEYKYEYDFIGRLVRSFATKDSANYLTSQVRYDAYNRISQQKFILGDGTNQSYLYFYTTKDSLIGGVVLPYSRNLAYTYDSLNRPVSKTLSGGTADISESYTYLAGAGENTTTPLVSRITYSDGKYLQYSYDALNNISAIVDSNGGKRTTYSYDGLGQLIRENNPYTNKSYVYAYDKGGNITSVTTYAYTTGALGTATSTVTYTYGDTAWKDKLTSYNGTNITYDSIGNPLSYRNGTLAWAGRQLKSHTSTSGTTTLYTYNSDGVRIGKKSVYQGNTSETSYVVSGTQILSETKGSSTNYYIYDDKGLPIGIVYNGTTYTYRKNIQGDIIAILDSTGAEVVTYTYNAWGVATVGGSLSSTLGAKNPFRYRGYYYDTETGYYYLNSRYYDPVTGRFLNADSFVSTGQGLLGYNMFAYCGNNPVMYSDPNGMILIEALIVAGLASADVFGAGATTVISDGPETEHTDPITRTFISVKTGTSVTETLTSIGDSSKPISVYAEGKANSLLESSAGLKLNFFGCTLNVSVGLSGTGVGLTLPNGGEQTQTHFIGVDLTELKLGYEVSVTEPIDSDKINTERSTYTNVGVSGRVIAAMVALFYTGTPGPFLQPATVG